MARKSRKKHRTRAGSRVADDEAREVHPLGIYGYDFDETYAYIAGFTSGGAPYGVAWEDATYLKDCPDVVAWLGEARCEELWGEEAMCAREAQRTSGDRFDDPDRSLPF